MSDAPLLHQTTKSQIDSILTSHNLNSIGLFGPIGVGKGFLAKFIIRKILETNKPSQNPYVKLIDCSGNVGIEQIREIKSFLSLLVPSENRFSRAVVIEHIEKLSLPAQNAMLKTLEEPPSGTVMIVTSADKNRILPTIISRLQWVNVLPLLPDQLASIDAAEADKQRAYLLSDGNAGMLYSYLAEPESFADYVLCLDEAKALLASNRFEKLAKIDSIIKNDSYVLDQLFSALAKILRSLILKNPDSPKTKDLAAKLRRVVEAQESLKHNPSQKLLLTTLFSKI